MKRNDQRHKVKAYLPDDVIKAIYGHRFDFVKSWINTDNIDSTDRDNRSAIFHAVLANSKEIVQVLLAFGANLNIRDNKGWYPLHYAAQNNFVEIADLLICNGADIEAKDNYGNTPLWRATFASQGQGEMITWLLKSGADKKNENNSGISPIKLASTIANYDVKQFF
ncbi:MAG TPA: ankyrin repeat domain-containing protein [Mucilaginibacter sp.]|nr:ankyrin repeat domain-containing protein [Mucilaginibacter sp.]